MIWATALNLVPSCTVATARCAGFESRSKVYVPCIMQTSAYQTSLTCTECEHNSCTLSNLFRNFFECHHRGTASVKVVSCELVRNLRQGQWQSVLIAHILWCVISCFLIKFYYVCLWVTVTHITNQCEGHNFKWHKDSLMIALTRNM